MSLLFQCKCGRQLQARDEDAGKQVRCPACSALLALPGKAPAVPASSTLPGPGRAAAEWYVARGRSKQGPYSSARLQQMAAAGHLQPTDMVLACGSTRWQTAATVPGLFPLPSGVQAPPPVAAFPSIVPPPLPEEVVHAARVVRDDGQHRATTRERRPWNPVAIAWLGLLFSPVWSGIMAAVNAHRLGLAQPLWRPLVVGIGSLLLYLAQDLMLDWYVLGLALYLGAVGIIWQLDLRPQVGPFRDQVAEMQVTGRWLVPALSGSPLALLVLLAQVVGPLYTALRPLEPREVCQRFNDAKTLEEMKRYTTSNLWPALEALTKLKDKDDPGTFELTDEAQAPAEMGGHLVGWRLLSKEGGAYRRIDGAFHLVRWNGDWKIEDIYFTAFDQRFLESPLSLAGNYKQIIAAAEGSLPQAPSADPEKVAKDLNNALEKRRGNQPPWDRSRQDQTWPRNVPAAAYLLGAKGGKALLAFLAAVGLGLAAFGKRLWDYFADRPTQG